MKTIRACIARYRLDLPTLVWTRGRAFPISSLETRLRCPQCGSRRVVVLFEPPSLPRAARAGARIAKCFGFAVTGSLPAQGNCFSRGTWDDDVTSQSISRTLMERNGHPHI